MKGFFKKSMIIAMILLLIGITLPVPEAVSAATLSQTTQDLRIVEGTTDEPNQYVTIITNEGLVYTKSDSNKKYTYTFPKAVEGQIVVYARDSYGFDQMIGTTTRPELEKQSPPVVPKEATYLGVIQDHFVFITHPKHTIHATYEGRVKSGLGELKIPKNKSETIEVYVSSPEKNSTTIQEYVAMPPNLDAIQLDAPPHEISRISGKTLPYLKLNIQLGQLSEVVQADADGRLDVPFTLWKQRAYQNQTYTIQPVHFMFDTKEGKQTFDSSAFQPNENEPVLSIIESLTQFTGVTYPGVDVYLDDEKCTTSEESGYFGCNYKMNDQISRTVTMKRENQTIFTKQVNVKRNPQTISFKTKAFQLEDAKLIATATPNQTFEVSYSEQRTQYHSYPFTEVKLRATSDANGNIEFSLPKRFKKSYTVSYIDEMGNPNFIESLQADDNRIVPKPNLEMNSDRIAITIPPFYSPDQKLWFEAKVDKVDGRSVLEKADLENPYVPIEVNDRYMVRTVLQDGRVSEWVTGKFDAIQKPVISEMTNHTKRIKGMTEPNAILKFTGGITKELTANQSGAFEFDVNLEKVKTFSLLVHVAGKTDQRFTYTIQDTMKPMLRIHDTMPQETNYLIFDANEYVGNFKIEYYKNKHLVRQETVKPINPYKPHSSGFSISGELPVSRLKQDGITHLIVFSEDLAKNASTGNKVLIKDMVAPRVTLQKYVLPGEQMIYGKTEPGSTVTYTYRRDQHKTVSVSKTGEFVIKTTDPIYTFKDGKRYSQVKITATDASGNSGHAYVSPVGEKIQDIRLNGSQKIWFYAPMAHMVQNQYEITVNGNRQANVSRQVSNVVTWENDITLPATITLKLINPDKTVKYQVTRTITKPYVAKTVSDVKFQKGTRTVVGKGEAHATLEVWSGPSRIGSTGIDGFGKFTVNLIRAYNEGESLRFVTINELDQKTSSVIKAKDNTAPPQPTVNDISAVTTKITGKTEKGATVLISYNKQTYTTKANNSGVYAYTIKKWIPGKQVSVQAKDASGNVSTKSIQTIRHVFKQFSVNPLKTSHVYVTGKGHPGATVQVYNGASKLGKAVKVDSKGNFKIYVNKQRQSNMLTIEMTRSGFASKKINFIVIK